MLITNTELGDVSDNYQKFMKLLRSKVKQDDLPWDEPKPAAVAA